MVDIIKIRMLENKIQKTDDIILKGAIQKKVKQLRIKHNIDSLAGFCWDDRREKYTY